MYFCSEVSWVGLVGIGMRLVVLLRVWFMLVFEVIEDVTSVSDGERLVYVLGCGFHRSVVLVNGDVVVGEEWLRGLFSRVCIVEDFQHGIVELFGSVWDVEFELYCIGGDGVFVMLFHQVV